MEIDKKIEEIDNLLDVYNDHDIEFLEKLKSKIEELGDYSENYTEVIKDIENDLKCLKENLKISAESLNESDQTSVHFSFEDWSYLTSLYEINSKISDSGNELNGYLRLLELYKYENNLNEIQNIIRLITDCICSDSYSTDLKIKVCEKIIELGNYDALKNDIVKFTKIIVNELKIKKSYPYIINYVLKNNQEYSKEFINELVIDNEISNPETLLELAKYYYRSDEKNKSRLLYEKLIIEYRNAEAFVDYYKYFSNSIVNEFLSNEIDKIDSDDIPFINIYLNYKIENNAYSKDVIHSSLVKYQYKLSKENFLWLLLNDTEMDYSEKQALLKNSTYDFDEHECLLLVSELFVKANPSISFKNLTTIINLGKNIQNIDDNSKKKIGDYLYSLCEIAKSKKDHALSNELLKLSLNFGSPNAKTAVAKEKVKKIISLATAVLVLFFSILLYDAYSKRMITIDLNDIVSYELYGMDGYGVLDINTNWDAFETKFKKEWRKNFIQNVEINTTKDQYLNNGDEISIIVTCDDELLRSSRVKFTNNEIKIKVENLTDPKDGTILNPNDFVRITFSGLSGFGEAIIDDDSNIFDYTLSKTSNLINGESITLFISYDAKELAKNNLGVEFKNENIIVSGLSKKLSSIKEVAFDSLAELIKESNSYVDKELKNTYPSFSETPYIKHEFSLWNALSFEKDNKIYICLIFEGDVTFSTFFGLGGEKKAPVVFAITVDNVIVDQNGNLESYEDMETFGNYSTLDDCKESISSDQHINSIEYFE